MKDSITTYANALVRYRSNLIDQLTSSPHQFDSLTSLNRLESQFIMPKLQRPNTGQIEVPIELALAQERHILIVGTAGSGKSTLLRLLALISARGLLREISNFPVLLQLSRLDPNISITDAIQQEIEKRAQSKIEESKLSESLTTGKVLVLLDGLNEAKQIEKVANQIRQFSKEFPQTFIVATSRIAADSNIGFGRFQIAPLSQSEIRQLIDIWYYDKPKVGESLWNILSHNSSLMALASNPLLFRLISDLYIKQRQLPKDRSTLQNLYITTFFSSLFKALSQSAILLAQHTALWMHSNKRSLLTRHELNLIIVQNMRPGNDQNLEKDIADLLHRSILAEGGLNQLQFTHLLLQEYFCAQALLSLERDVLFQFVIMHANDSWWDSVFVYLAQQLADAGELISILTNRGDTAGWLLAAKLLTQGAHAKQDIRFQVINNLCTLLTQDNSNAALSASDILVQFEDPKVDQLCYSLLERESSDPMTASSSAYVLAARGKEPLNFYRILATTLRSTNADARYQTCKALGVLDTQASTELLIESLKSESNTKVLEQTMSSLCRRNIYRRVSSTSLIQLFMQLDKLKHKTKDTDSLREWVGLLERKLLNEQESSIEA